MVDLLSRKCQRWTQAAAAQSMWWSYCQVAISGLVSFMVIGISRSRTTRATSPAALLKLCEPRRR